MYDHTEFEAESWKNTLHYENNFTNTTIVMSNKGFAFPPPPPPPPKKDVLPGKADVVYGQGNRGAPINRGNDRGRASYSRGRGFGGSGMRDGPPSGPRGGRGQSFSRGVPPRNDSVAHREWYQGYSSRGNASPGRPPASSGIPQGPRSVPSHNSLQLNAAQKRNHATAFISRGRGVPRPLAAPAVPSFLSNIAGLSPRTPPALAGAPESPTERKPKPRITNILGLNPSTQDPESASDDEDEEAKLASTITAASKTDLTYEYRGQTATLKTSAEIAAWIAERRKRYPTAAKAEQAKKEAEEKKRKWGEEKKANIEARRLQRDEYEKRKESEAKVPRWMNESSKPPVEAKGKEDDAAEKARLKTEKLIKKAAKTQKQLAKAQDVLKKAQKASASNTTPNTIFEDEQGIAGILDGQAAYPGVHSSKSSDASSILTDSDDEETSSSGSSSEESSNSAPETQTTKRTAPDRVSLPPRGPALQNVCRNMMKSGICKHGKKCKYSHVLPESLRGPDQKRVDVSQVTGRLKRKGLWEVMVEKEREEERRVVLKAIMEMGERGFLSDDVQYC